MKSAKHILKSKPKPLSIRKHAQLLGKLGGRPRNDEKEVRLTPSQR